MVVKSELIEKREQQKKFETDFFTSAKIVESEVTHGVRIYRIESSYQSKSGIIAAVHAQITPADRIQYIPNRIRAKLLAAYQSEFVRAGSYMQHPSKGHVVTFSIDANPVGFFYLGENEVITQGSTQSVLKHLQEGTLLFDELPDLLQKTIIIYLSNISNHVDLSSVGNEVTRPMRFYVYPEAQGNGSLKVLLSLVSLAAAVLNQNQKKIHQLVEARAGLVSLGAGSTSTLSDHQLVPLYLSKGYEVVTTSAKTGNKLPAIVWENHPYRNMSIVKPDHVDKILYLASLPVPE